MSPEFALNYFLPAVAFAIGACIGSFLNVVIYRVPLGMSVGEPKRSFCPNCKKQIPAWLNIPLVTWLMLRGKCKWCKSEISFRYFLVELLTAFVFFAIWQLFFASIGIWGVVALWIFSALLIAATFIDFDHMIIPDSITLGGLGVGLAFSALVPALHNEKTWHSGLLAGLVGAALGFFLLWSIVLLGKMMFGQIKHEFEEPVEFAIYEAPSGDDTEILCKFGDDLTYTWNDLFYRASDRLEMDISELRVQFLPGSEGADPKIIERSEEEKFVVKADGIHYGGEETSLEGLKRISGKCSRATVPREAMGFGDVKFIAMIGAFQGWQAVLITVMAACCIGAITGSIQKVFLKESKIPFGPYLALGAFIFIFTGAAIWNWYSGMWQGAFQ